MFSLRRSCGEEYGTVEAAFVIARGATQPIDIATVQGEGDSPQVSTPFYAFLSLSWGIVADIDIESEKFRVSFCMEDRGSQPVAVTFASVHFSTVCFHIIGNLETMHD